MITKPSVDKQDTQINYIAELNRFEFRPSHKANEFPPVLKDSTNSLPFSDSTDSRTYEVFHKLPLRELVRTSQYDLF